ncbi:hypothetical protein WJX79_009290 [Trebouxia sp. C0005]
MNQYHIYEAIGRGKHSVVYKGRKKKSIQYYAIKSVEKTQKPRVLQEVRTMHALENNNILKFFAWYETSNHLWLILEYCVGGDLMSLLRQDMRLPESSIHDFGRDLVISIQYLHSNAIIYCDLKPSNILLDENGRIKLGGFGLSRRLSDINKISVQQLPPAKRGTPCYMAPELFQDGSTHSSAADLWALGCVLYECAAGHPPFVSTSFNHLVNDILTGTPADLPNASPDFQDLISQLLVKNPATRLTWEAMCGHPFWQTPLSQRPMPPEPMLDAFIKRHGLRPVAQPAAVQANGQLEAHVKAAQVRDSTVDVMRLSIIVRNNLEKESDGSEYHAASSSGAPNGDVKLNHTDAELDFEEQTTDAGGPGSSEEDEGLSPTAHVMDDSGAPPAGTLDPGGAKGLVEMPDSEALRRSVAAANAVEHERQLASSNASQPALEGERGPVPATSSDFERPAVQSEGPAEQPSTSGTPRPSVYELIWHVSDSSVKPIVANRRIERLPEPKWDAQALPFKPLALQDMLSASQQDLEAFLTQVYRAIAGAAPLKDKVNVLAYFETLCTDTGAANVLINSSLTILIVRMLRNARAPTLRVRLASALGLLVRHATYIADELATTGVIEVLTEGLKDKNERVRRRIMATLGELLFYVATQQQDASQMSQWQVPTNTITLVGRMLKPGEDEIAQHYAIKTIENIGSQAGTWATRFGSSEVVSYLITIWQGSKNDNIRATAASTLSRLMRHSPTLLAPTLEKYSLKPVVQGLADDNAKVQAAAANMLNLALTLPDAPADLASVLEELQVVPGLLAVLESPVAALRAKALVSFALLTQTHLALLLAAFQLKLSPQVEKLQRDTDQYTSYAMASFSSAVEAAVPVLLQKVSKELATGHSGPKSPHQATDSALALFPLLQQLLICPVFRPVVVSDALIADLSAYLAASASAYVADLGGIAQFQGVLLQCLEALCQYSDQVVAHHKAVLAHLLPALAAAVGRPGESRDSRFLCLKLLCDVILHFLLETDLYSVPSQQQQSQANHAGSASQSQRDGLKAVVSDAVLPLIPAVLEEEDPMPLYALKLLVVLLDTHPTWALHLQRLGLVPRFFEFLSLEHSNNNVHNIRLCRLIISNADLTSVELADMQVAEKVSAVLAYSHENAVEPFLEPVVGLCQALLDRDQQDMHRNMDGAGTTDMLLPAIPILLELSAHLDSAISCIAAHCLATLTEMFTQDAAAGMLSGDGLLLLADALQPAGQRNPASVEGPASLGFQPPVNILAGDLLQLKRAVQYIAQTQDKNTVLEQPAREALQYLAALGAQ